MHGGGSAACSVQFRIALEMVDSEQIRERIRRDGAELHRLHRDVHATCARRDESPAARERWIEAASLFRNSFDLLAFPGGEVTMKVRVQCGDPLALECAICFLEVRPFFFHSGYMFKDLMRWCGKAKLSPEQRDRYEAVRERWLAWRAARNARRKQ